MKKKHVNLVLYSALVGYTFNNVGVAAMVNAEKTVIDDVDQNAIGDIKEKEIELVESDVIDSSLLESHNDVVSDSIANPNSYLDDTTDNSKNSLSNDTEIIDDSRNTKAIGFTSQDKLNYYYGPSKFYWYGTSSVTENGTSWHEAPPIPNGLYFDNTFKGDKKDYGYEVDDTTWVKGNDALPDDRGSNFSPSVRYRKQCNIRYARPKTKPVISIGDLENCHIEGDTIWANPDKPIIVPVVGYQDFHGTKEAFNDYVKQNTLLIRELGSNNESLASSNNRFSSGASTVGSMPGVKVTLDKYESSDWKGDINRKYVSRFKVQLSQDVSNIQFGARGYSENGITSDEIWGNKIVEMDKTKPEGALSTEHTEDGAFVTATYSDSDSGVGVVKYRLSGAQTSDWTKGSKASVTKVGTTKIDFIITDNVGNETALTTSVSVAANDWVNKDVANQVNKVFTSLTQEDYLRITTISLPDKGLTGPIPETISKLVNLENLNIPNNSLTGALGTHLGNLKKLKSISIDNNGFSGSIPRVLTELPQLEHLGLNGNLFSGSIPSGFGSLKKLRSFIAYGNKLTGSIPEDIYNSKSIQRLELGDNALTGSISPKIGGMSSLKALWIENCNITGALPKELFSLQNIEDVLLFGNKLTGSIPVEASTSSSLKVLNLTSNNMTGELPKNLKLDTDTGGRYWGTYYSDFSDNQFVGSIPKSLSSNISEEKFSQNLMTGVAEQKELILKNTPELILDIGDVLDIKSIDLSSYVKTKKGNESLSSVYKLTSSIEDESMFDKNYKAIKDGATTVRAGLIGYDFLSSNAVNVVINPAAPDEESPSIAASLSTTKWTKESVSINLTASDNVSVKKIVTEDGEEFLSNKASVVVESNGIYKFKAVDTSDNETEISVKVSNIDKEAPKINVSYSEDSATVVEVSVEGSDTLSGLKEMYGPEGNKIASSKFVFEAKVNGKYNVRAVDNVGNVTSVTIDITNIEDSLLDGKWLDNEVARQCKKSVDKLTDSDYAKVKKISLSGKGIVGKIPSHINKLTNLESIDISNNQIGSTIPTEFTQLKKLRVVNFSDNNLTGSIPSNIVNLIALQSLDLSFNYISGAVPEKIGSIKTLRHLFLCENRLTGSVPESIASLKEARDICLDYNQFVGKISDKIRNMSAFINFDYNFLEDEVDFATNKITLDDNIVMKVASLDDLDANKIRDNIYVTTDYNKPIYLAEGFEPTFVFDKTNTLQSNIFRAQVGLLFNGQIVSDCISDQYVTVVLEDAPAEETGSITVRYVDDVSGNIIAESSLMENLSLGSYIVESKDIEGYTVIGSPNITVDVTSDSLNNSVEFRYKLNVEEKGSVTVEYIDASSGSQIRESDVHQDLSCGEYTFNSVAIDGYSIVGASTINVEVTSENLNQSVTFSYKKIDAPVTQKGSISVSYIDKSTGEHIDESLLINDLPYGTYSIQHKDIAGYSVVNDNSVAVDITADNLHHDVVFEYEKNESPVEQKGSITIDYIDDLTGISISDSTFMDNLEYGEYSVEPKVIDNYTVVGENPVSVTIQSDSLHKRIQFRYRKQPVFSGTIKISYVDDATGANIVDPEIHENLQQGSYSYTAKAFAGYTLTGPTIIDVQIDASNVVQEIIFVYKKTIADGSIDNPGEEIGPDTGELDDKTESSSDNDVTANEDSSSSETSSGSQNSKHPIIEDSKDIVYEDSISDIGCNNIEDGNSSSVSVETHIDKDNNNSNDNNELESNKASIYVLIVGLLTATASIILRRKKDN